MPDYYSTHKRPFTPEKFYLTNTQHEQYLILQTNIYSEKDPTASMFFPPVDPLSFLQTTKTLDSDEFSISIQQVLSFQHSWLFIRLLLYVCAMQGLNQVSKFIRSNKRCL